jgi:hypothetical protein
MLRFVDGHDQHRMFCRSCGSSFLDAAQIAFVPSGQKSLLGFEAGIYQRPGFSPMR